MKIRGHIYLIFISLLIGSSHSISAVNYYEMLGLRRDAGVDTIRKKCEGAEIIRRKKAQLANVKKRKGGKEYVRSELARQRKTITSQEDIRAITLLEQDIASLTTEEAALEKEVARLIRVGRVESLKNVPAEEIGRACEVLRNPTKKSEYDQQIGVREREITERERGVFGAEIAGSYYEELMLSPRVPDAEVRARCDLRRRELSGIANNKKVARGTARSDADRRRLDAEVKEVEKKLANTNVACQTLLDPKMRKEYDKKLVEPKKGVFGMVTRGVEGAKKDADKLLVDLAGEFLSKIPIPNASVSFFNQKLAMRNMSFVKAPSGPNVRTGLGFTGTMVFNNMSVQGTMYVVEDRGRRMQYSLSVALPEHYKISSMFPKFKKLDLLSLPRAKLVVSSFDYYDLDGFSIKRGLNLAATLDLTGPLKMLGNLKDRALKATKQQDRAKKLLQPVVVRAEPIRFQGVIPIDIQKAEFSATIPMYFGIDFTKIPRMPKTITKVFKEFTTDDLEFVVTAVPTVSFTIETGVRLVLGTQREPVRLSAFGVIEPTMFSLGVRMRNMLQLYFLAIGNVGIQIDWDDALAPIAALFGIPFTGIGLNGQIDLGKEGESRAVFKVSGGARVRSGGMADLVFEAEANNIRFADLLRLLLKMAAKVKITRDPMPFGRLPAMTLERVRGYLALEDTKIAGKSYDAGFALEVDTHFFNRRAGFSIDLKHTAMTASGSGYISNIEVRARGKDIFRLTGPAFVTRAGQRVEGPAIDFNFGLKEPSKGRFGVRGSFEVPAIDLKQAVDFVWEGWNLRANIESRYAGFTVVFGAQVNMKAGAPEGVALPDVEEKGSGTTPTKEKIGDPTKKWQQMYLRFGFKGDFAKFLTEQARPAIDKLRNSASEQLGRLNEEVGNLSRKVTELGQKGVTVASEEIRKTRDKINEIKRKIETLTKERGSTKRLIKKGQLTAQIATQRVAQKAQEVFLEGLLKPGRKVIAGASQAVGTATKALHEAQILKRSVEATLGGLSTVTGAIAKGVTIFQVKEAIGEFSSEDIMAGKLPKLISLKVETNIPGVPKVSVNLNNIQFDFKKPIKSGQAIVEQIFRGGIKFK